MNLSHLNVVLNVYLNKVVLFLVGCEPPTAASILILSWFNYKKGIMFLMSTAGRVYHFHEILIKRNSKQSRIKTMKNPNDVNSSRGGRRRAQAAGLLGVLLWIR